MAEIKQKSIKKNFIMNAILTMLAFIFPLITFPYVARVVGPTGNGAVEFATSIVSYFAMVAQLGIPTYGIRVCAKVRDDKKKLSQTVHELLTINLIMSLMVYVLFFISLFLIPRFHKDRVLMIIISSTILFNLIGVEYLYKALEQYTYITIRSIVFKAISVIAMFLLVKSPDDYVMYGVISIFAASASNVLNYIHARKLIYMGAAYRREVMKASDRRLNISEGVSDGNATEDAENLLESATGYRQHLKPILVFFAMSCATTIYLHLDTAMLGFMKTEADVGYYDAAVKIKSILVSVVTSLGTVLLPRASYYIEHGEYEEFGKITTKALHFVCILATPLMIYFMFFAKEGVLLLSGYEYLPAVPAMVIIMPTLLFIGISNITGIQILVPMGKEKIVLYSEIAGAIVDLILNMIFIPTMKAAGAALGTVVAELVVTIVQLFFIIRDKEVMDRVSVPAALKKVRYYKTVFAVAVASVAAIWVKWISLGNLESKVEVASFIRLAISAICFFGIYLVLMLIMKDEMMKEVVNTVLKKVPGLKKLAK